MNVKSAKKRGMLPKGVNTYRNGVGSRVSRQTAAYKKNMGNCKPKNCGYA